MTEITLNSLFAAKNAIELMYGDVASKLKISRTAFNRLYDLVLEDIEGVEIDKTENRPVDPKATIFGIRIIVDDDMKDGEWKFIK
jgi:hypothetical protein